MIYFISDTHFNHDKGFIYEPRKFDSMPEMNERLIANWNKVVSPDDTVYVVGDFFLGADMDYVLNTLKRLNGNIILVRGNHDSDAKIRLYEQTGKILDIVWATQITYKKRNFFICHYPTMTANFGDKKNPDKVIINIFGHTHSPDKFYEGMANMYNVACDAHDCTPVSIEEIYSDVMEALYKR